MKITHPKDFYAGLMFFTIGLIAMILAFGYPLGTSSRMGPGYFPRVLGGLLMFLGGLLAVLSFRETGGQIGHFAWKAIGLVLGAIVLFAATVNYVGLVIATVLLIFVSGYASKEFNWKESLISSIVLAAVSVGLFIVGLKLQFPIFPWGM